MKRGNELFRHQLGQKVPATEEFGLKKWLIVTIKLPA